MLPIVAKLNNVIQAQTSEIIYFECEACGLRIWSANATNYSSVTTYLKLHGIELHIHNAIRGQQVKYILRGLLRFTECEEIMTGLREEVAEITHTRQLKRKLIEDDNRVLKLIPLWIVTIQIGSCNVSGVRILAIRPNSAILSRCVNCTGGDNTQYCKKEAAKLSKCKNCDGQLLRVPRGSEI